MIPSVLMIEASSEVRLAGLARCTVSRPPVDPFEDVGGATTNVLVSISKRFSHFGNRRFCGLTKARKDGSNYVYSLLTGYQAQPAELVEKFPASKTGPGLHYNPYFANLNLAMAPPLTTDGQVTYADGAPEPTIDQMAQDVAAFLTWTAEPKMEHRKQTGVAVLIFLLFATVLAYLSKQQIWSGLKRREDD